MHRDDIEGLQEARLREQVQHVYKNAAFFEELYDEASVRPKDLESLEDLSKLPTFDKDDLRAYRDRTGDFWCGCLCVPESELVYATHSTGTSGDPNFFGFTERDMHRIGEHTARQWYAWGLRKGDKVNMLGSMYWHAMVPAAEQGIRHVGATPVRRVGGNQDIAEQVFTELDNADLDAIYVYQPEYEKAHIEENDIDPQEVFPNLRFVCTMADASPPKRELWESVWGVPLRNSFASGDQVLSTVQCRAEDEYFHVNEDHFIFEVLDSETGEPVAPGEYGELHVTNLRDEANPYLRYNLEDYVTYKLGECECGRTTMRLRPLGRESWSIQVTARDQPITSIEVEGVLWRFEDLYGKNYQMVQVDPDAQDELRVRIAAEEPIPNDILADAESALSDEFGVPATVTVVSTNDIGLESAAKLERVAEEY